MNAAGPVQMSMSARVALCSFSCFLGMQAACLPEGKPVDGRNLFRSRSVEKPRLLTVDGKPFVTFEVRKLYPLGGKMGATDLWMNGWDEGSDSVLLAANKSDRWDARDAGAGALYVMHDERILDDGSPEGKDTPVATLSRVSLMSGLQDSVEDVARFTVDVHPLLGPLLLYWKVTPHVASGELHVRDASGKDRALSRDVGAWAIGGQHGVFFTDGGSHVLRRLAGIDQPIETFRTNVVGFTVTDDEGYAILEVLEGGERRTVAYHLASHTEQVLPGRPCCWLDFIEVPPGDRTNPAERWQFRYSESAQGGRPGWLNGFNLGVGLMKHTPLVEGLIDVKSIIRRPHGEPLLLVDSRGRVAEYIAAVPGKPKDSMRLLDIDAVSLDFTPNGRFAVYVRPETKTPEVEGKLLIQDADFRAPAGVLSPPGFAVQEGAYTFHAPEPGGILFWAHFGLEPDDLYVADPETGHVRSLARGIGGFSIVGTDIISIVRVSGQDLIGDLVRKSSTTGAEQVMAHSVFEYALDIDPDTGAGRVAFVIHERVDTGRDGLWAAPLPATPAPPP